MSKHTPGPWEQDTEDAEWGNSFVVNAGDWIIAEMIDGEDETRRANARLIAAAPDMLEALLAIRNADTPLSTGDASVDAERAIAKATKPPQQDSPTRA